jgi:hypothetical protein
MLKVTIFIKRFLSYFCKLKCISVTDKPLVGYSCDGQETGVEELVFWGVPLCSSEKASRFGGM